MRLAIVGAGLAGLAAASRLHETRPEIDVVVYEAGREVGGRAATCLAHGVVFDHGAQYLKTPSPELHQFITQTLDHSTLVDINREVWSFDGTGRISPGDPAQNADPKWTYSDGLARLARELAAGIDVRLKTSVERFAVQAGGGFTLLGPDGTVVEQADLLLLTPPAPRTADIVGGSELPAERRDALVEELARAVYRRCLSVALGYVRPPRERSWYALVNADRQHPISWLAYEHLKPGRAMGGQGVLIAQMAPGWSAEHWETGGDELGHVIAALVSGLLDEDLHHPAWWDRYAWRDALPDGGCDAGRLHSGDGLFFAGDYLAGQGRLHLAIEQGWAAAARVAELC